MAKTKATKKNKQERKDDHFLLSLHQRKAKRASMPYHLLPILLGNSKKTDLNINCWQVSGSTGSLIYYREKCKVVQLLWKTILYHFVKLKIHNPYDMAISHFGKQPRKTLEQSLCTRGCVEECS